MECGFVCTCARLALGVWGLCKRHGNGGLLRYLPSDRMEAATGTTVYGVN